MLFNYSFVSVDISFLSAIYMYIFQISVDWRNIAGWDAVDRLTDQLLTITTLSMSHEDTLATVLLYNQLDSYDKRRTSFEARHQKRLLSGRFKVSKKREGVAEGVDSARR